MNKSISDKILNRSKKITSFAFGGIFQEVSLRIFTILQLHYKVYENYDTRIKLLYQNIYRYLGT